MSTSAARANHLALVSTTSTSKPPFLYRRDRLYYFKRKVPRDCRELFGGKRQVWKSLGTDQLEKAKVMLTVEVTEFDLTVARYRRERAACAAGVIPLSRPRAHASTVAAPGPGGEATPASLAHLDVLRSVEAAFEQLRVLMAPQVALAPAVVPMPLPVPVPVPVPEHPRATANQQSSASSPQRGRIQPTMLHLLEDWKRKQTRPRTIGAVQNAVLEFHALHGSLPVDTINCRRRSKSEPPRRSNIEPGVEADFEGVGCG